MSPERLDGQQYSFSADIWGLGISLIQLATGEHPYEGMTASQETEMKFWTLVTHLKERPAPTPQGNFSAEFKDFVSQCLFKEKEKRASAGDLLEHPWIKLYASGDDGEAQSAIEQWLATADSGDAGLSMSQNELDDVLDKLVSGS
jgi:serine/threonine protein kinase